MQLTHLTIEQYGKVIRISELAELTAKHPLIESSINRLGLHAAELYDSLIYSVLDAASNTYRPNNRATDGALLASDAIGNNDFLELNALLHTAGGVPFGGEYVFVTSPQPYGSIQKDPDVKASRQLAKPEQIWRGEADMAGGFRIVKSNAPAFVALTTGGAGFSDKVYSSFALAQNAYQVVDLQNLEVNVVAPGGRGDILKQSYLIGYVN